MAKHIAKGKEGELLACKYLTKRDYEIIVCNWRHKHLEIDIIALKEGVIHFIEVKTRHSMLFGYPEESVTRSKFNNLKKGAAVFLSAFREERKIQFDILSILIFPGKEIEYFFIEDFYLY